MKNENTPRINDEYVEFIRSHDAFSDKNHFNPIRRLVVDYNISYEKARKLVGKTEKETLWNIEEFKKNHVLKEKTIFIGGKIHNVKFGYEIDTTTGETIENKDEQKTIRIVVRERKKGMSYNEIIEYLNNKKIRNRNGKKWYPSTIMRVLKASEK